MTQDIPNIVLLALAFLFLFLVAEIFYHVVKIQAEHTRKFVHIGTGILTLLFPILLRSHWSVFLLCGSFWIILQLSLKFDFLKSINAIGRRSRGSTLYPIIVCLIFWFYEWYSKENKSYLYFYLPILTMAICDPIAALVGEKWGLFKYSFMGSVKSYIGSAAFFFTSFFLSCIIIYWCGYSFNTNTILVSIIIAFGSTIAEALSGKGYDNFTIPLTVAFVLAAFQL